MTKNTKSQPPKILVKTWLTLIHSSESLEVKEHAMLMLKNAFNSTAEIEAYLREHNLTS